MGKCIEYKASRSIYFIEGKKVGRYVAGQKRCSTCDIFIRYEGTHCPCCGMRLKIKMRSQVSSGSSRLDEKGFEQAQHTS